MSSGLTARTLAPIITPSKEKAGFGEKPISKERTRHPMRRHALTARGTIILVLILQFIPLVLFPPASFSPATQEWWLPILLAVMILIADVELIARRSPASWPWDLVAFAQGFNVISRLMMLWPHATLPAGGANVPYVLMALLSMLLSAFLLWYTALPDVRLGLIRA
jgi:hypothetical protein